MGVKDFNQEAQNYGANKPPTDRYFQAEEEYYDRIGNPTKQKHNWMRFAFLEGWIILALIAGLVFMSTKSSVTPYVVQVGPDGMAMAITQARSMNYTPQEQEIKYHLKLFVERARGLGLDPIVNRRNWDLTYAYMRPEAANKMSAIFKNENPASRIGKETVMVNVAGLPTRLPESKNSYQVRWTEETFGQDGNLKGTAKYNGVFMVDLSPPTQEKELVNNPLGIFVRDFNFSKEF